MSPTASTATLATKPKLSRAAQERVKWSTLHFLEIVLREFGDQLDPKYIWRLKGAISLLRGKNPNPKRG